MIGPLSRRDFLATSGRSLAGLTALHSMTGGQLFAATRRAPLFDISLAEWSLHRALQAHEVDNLDFARIAREEFDIGAIEYVNQFFKDKATDASYLADLNQRAADHGVYQHLIMCDGEGRLGDPDEKARLQAVQNHHRWIDAARTLGCITIRVNAASEGTWDEQAKLAADGLSRLSEYGEKIGINVIVENHGGLSSNGKWLSHVMQLVDSPRCGTLPDFGNFNLGNGETYDRYEGVTELMPFAKAVSAKSHDFDESGNETSMDYRRLMKIVLDAGFHSWVGIEYEGDRIPEREGIRLTKRLLERVRSELA